MLAGISSNSASIGARMQRFFNYLSNLLGIDKNSTSHTEKLISVAGVLIGLITIREISSWYLADSSSLLMIASMGASAILIFGMPHGALSQPWPVMGGHLVAATIGVTLSRFFPIDWWTPALAVALAMGAMHYLHCIHPPGGATAMIAVIGGEQVHSLGYAYLFTPVLMNVVSLLLVAILFNSLFPWRRYPVYLALSSYTEPQLPKNFSAEPEPEDFDAALAELDSYRDITTEELTELYQRAKYQASLRIEEENRKRQEEARRKRKVNRLLKKTS
ncbi:HPP family protein [Marinospirillum celere]|uniref:HPP family protein n=1 Tax=Marinospirillum celere TaxID=1122252 RepID=A0A1I1E055_9GAMM|nr:HPP family protein [Marinospirillum celere]SFB78330.1 HPP family protein [Marinospirillum celere]